MFLIIHFILYISFCLFIIPIGIIIGMKLYKNIKNEEHKEKGKVIQKIMKTYAIVQCFSWPFLMIWHGFLHVNAEIHVIPHSTLRYIFSLTRFLSSLNTDYVSFNSLIIAICRYIFLVFESNAERIGIAKLRNILIGASLGVPIFRSLLHQATVPIEENFHLTFFPFTDDFAQNKSTADFKDSSDMSSGVLESPLYTFVQHVFPSTVTWGMKCISDVMVFIMYSNILEGIIYAHTFIFARRFKHFLYDSLLEAA